MDKRPLIELHAAVLLFGLSGLFGKLLDLSPYAIVFGRTSLATLALAVFLVFSSESIRLPAGRDLFAICLSGVILTVHWLSFFYSIQLATVAVGLLTFSSFPVFVTFLEPFFFQETLEWFDIYTTLGVFTGLVLVVPVYHLANQVTQGALWGILSGLTFAVLAVCNRKYVKTYSALLIACLQNGVTAIILVPVLISIELTLTTGDLINFLVLGIFCTAVAHGLFIKSLRLVKVQLAAVTTGLEPIYGIFFAFIIIDEVPSLRMLVGGAIIIGTTAVATIKRQCGK
jgi:drug/metabolite transporter (DMT)-like permease